MNNQSGVIFGFVFAAFFVYITLKGELPIYAGLLLLSPASGNAVSVGGAGPTANNPTSQATSAANSLISAAITGGLY